MSRPGDRPPVVSLIVPVKDDAKYLGQCLESLVGQDYPAERLEIIVVDGRSADDSKEIALSFAERDGRIRLLDNPRIITAAAANLGIEAARGDLVAIISSHSTLEQNYVRAIVEVLSDRPDLACAGGSMKTVGSGYMGKAIASVLSSPFGVGGSKFRTADRTQPVDTLAFGLCRRQVFDQIGLFNENLVRNEDNDFHWRLRRDGGRLLLVAGVHSHYYGPETMRALSRQAFNNGLWNIRLLRLTGAGLAGRHLAPLLFVLALLAAVGLSLAKVAQPLAIAASVYMAAASIAALSTGSKRGWRFVPILPILFLLLHTTYGLGSAAGLVEVFPRRGAWQPVPAGKAVPSPRKQKEKV